MVTLEISFFNLEKILSDNIVATILGIQILNVNKPLRKFQIFVSSLLNGLLEVVYKISQKKKVIRKAWNSGFKEDSLY